MLTTEQRLGKARNRIRLVGVELEGGWDAMPAGCDGPIRDGSVEFPPPSMPEEINRLINSFDATAQRKGMAMLEKWKQSNRYPQWVGELPSPAMPVKEVDSWVRKFYPHYVNASCGLHVHMSFNTNLTYQRLMTMPPTGQLMGEYENTIIELLTKWATEEGLPDTHPFWPRLQGKCQYCKVGNKIIDKQARLAKKAFERNAPVNRYYGVNYSFSTHGTIEIRFLPMFEQADQALRAVRRVLDITNAFILTQLKRETTEAVRVELDGQEADRYEYKEAM